MASSAPMTPSKNSTLGLDKTERNTIRNQLAPDAKHFGSYKLPSFQARPPDLARASEGCVPKLLPADFYKATFNSITMHLFAFIEVP